MATLCAKYYSASLYILIHSVITIAVWNSPVIIPILQMRKLRQKWDNFLKVTQPVSGRARICAQAVLALNFKLLMSPFITKVFKALRVNV